jgi:hypothetical protein
MDTCEINRDGAWETVKIADALKTRNEMMRCVACHGRVIPTIEPDDGVRPHFSHLRSFAYCSGDPSVPSQQHPHPLA